MSPLFEGAVVLGAFEGRALGTPVGRLDVGRTVGCVDGCVLGCMLGCPVGLEEGCPEG